jgi:hypothetical protein
MLILAYRAGRGARWLLMRTNLWVRLLIVIGCLELLAPAQARIPAEPPQVVQTEHPILCVHTRLDMDVTDLDIFRTLQMVREMGATTIVQLFYWAYIQPQEDTFDWAGSDRIVNMAAHQGLRVIARLGIVPAWARPKPEVQATSLEYLPPERYADYARFVAAFAARYRGKVDRIIPWNEPNLAFEWGYRLVPAAEYVGLLRQVYEAAHAANPDVIILGGALAPTVAPPGSADGLNDVLYLRQMYQAGAKPYFDALAVHTYGFTLPPDDPPGLDRLNFRRVEMLMGVMREFGDGDKPVYITESSWNDNPRWIYAVRPGQRIQYTLDSLKYTEQHWPTVKNQCFWYFRSAILYRTYQDYYAFVTVDFRPKPIYDEVQKWARGLDQNQQNQTP